MSWNWRDEVFENYKNNYIKIFGVIYPAKGNTGFPEKNLSVNFAKAYEKKFKNSVTWYELQFGDDNDWHIDAVIIDSNNNRILLIESKRFDNPSQKIYAIKNDINRINDLKIELLNDSNDRISEIEIYEFYGVVLADVWLETEPKNKIFNEYLKGTFVKDNLGMDLKELYYDTKGFDNDKVKNDNVRNYKLLSFLWELE